jgi:hypothetical protein
MMLIVDGKKKAQEKKEEKKIEKLHKEHQMRYSEGHIKSLKFQGSLQVGKG